MLLFSATKCRDPEIRQQQANLRMTPHKRVLCS
jgi:hypothetical protein